jgi:glutaredoxin
MARCVVYGASWCGDTRRSRALLEAHGVDYDWHDIDAEPEHLDTVIRYAGKRKVPVIVFVDGTCLVEPADEELAAKLGL